MNPQDFKIRASQCGKIMSNAKIKGELSQTCKSYLHAWYANDKEEVYSKYINKGNEVEIELIDFMAIQLGFGLAEKNTVTLVDEFIIGTCDVNLPECIVDVKASWNRKTLQEQVINGIDSDYEWQLQIYCHLYKKKKGILFFGLCNTPETDYEDEVVYEDMPDNERWIAYEVIYDPEKIQAVIERVKLCREYLKGYEMLLKSKMGKIN